MASPLISVIVPVYNAEPYLRRCLDSIKAQTFTDFEAILVNDGSTDKSGAICNEYAEKDSRFIVIHQPNGGVSTARNHGLAVAKGEWIAFVDADDTVSPDYLAHLYTGVQTIETENVLVIGSYMIGGQIKKILPNQTLYKEVAAIYIMNEGILALSGPVAKLFNKKILECNHVTFPEKIHMGEDGIFLQRYLNIVDAVSFISDVDYYVHSTEGSLSKCVFSFDSEWNCYVTWKRYISEYVERYKSVFPMPDYIIWNNRVGKTFLRCLFSVSSQNPRCSIKQQLIILKSIPSQEYLEYGTFYKAKTFPEKFYKFIIVRHCLLLFVLIINRRRFFSLCQK